MNPNFLLCDICESQVPRDNRVFMATGTQMDGAGSRDDQGYELDLCGKCYSKMVDFLNRDGQGLGEHNLAVAIKNYIHNRKSKAAR